jgi:8-oxo-dGTP pyrophosphatase MutT (NUDIX family)
VRVCRIAYGAGVDPPEELLNVYDAEGRVAGAMPRRAAKRSSLAVGAVNALVLGPDGRVLLQLRPEDKENGGLWDKTVGGHVSAGEEFDATVVREAGEELFDDPASPRVRLLPEETPLDHLAEAARAGGGVVLRRLGLQLNLRDVRHAPGRAGVRVVRYHVAIYAGRTTLAAEAFRPQAEEIQALRFFAPAEVDAMLLGGRLAPNMAFLWLTRGRLLVGEEE